MKLHANIGSGRYAMNVCDESTISFPSKKNTSLFWNKVMHSFGCRTVSLVVAIRRLDFPWSTTWIISVDEETLRFVQPLKYGSFPWMRKLCALCSLWSMDHFRGWGNSALCAAFEVRNTTLCHPQLIGWYKLGRKFPRPIDKQEQ